MAYRTWGRVLLAALGVGLLAGAGQLGFAYGLGVVRFARDFEQSPGQWTAHLAWVAWFAMLAAVTGALAGSWLAARDDLRPTLGSRVAVAVAGGVGALAVAPLAMLPSRVASIPSGSPVTIAGLSAVLGALVGVFAAVAVLSQRVAGLNLGAVTVVIWLVALLSVAPSLGPDDPLPEVRLGVLDATWLGEGLAQRLAVIVMPAIALAAGAGIGALARWRGLPVIPVAVSGVVGPALLALAYLIAGPGDDADRYQAAPYWGALIAVAAGGLGSVLAAVARQLTGERAEAGAAGRHGDHTAEVFPGDSSTSTPTRADDEPTRPGGRGFDPWGSDKPAAGGDDNPTSSFGRADLDPPPGRSGDDLFGSSTDRDRPGSAGSGGFGTGRADRDSFGGAGSSAFGGGRDDRDTLGSAGSGAFGSERDDRDPLGGSGSSASGGGRRDRESFGGSGSSAFGGGGDDRDRPGGSGSSAFGGGRDDRDRPGGAGSGGFGGGRRGDTSTAGDTFGAAARDPLGGSESRLSGGSFAQGRDRVGNDDDPLGGSGPGRALDLGDVERSVPPRAGDGPPAGSLFNPPTPVAPPRRPEVVSPPPIAEPTPVRPFERQPSTGPGDWRTDQTSTFTAASVPVVPANGPQRRDDGDLHQRPTAIRPQPPVAGRVPRQPATDAAGGLAPIDLPGQSDTAWPASGSDPSGRAGQAGDLGRRGALGRPDDPAQTSGAGHPGSAGWSGRSDRTGVATSSAGGPTTAPPSQAGGEMPDWRLAPPAWTPPPPVTPGEPAEAGPEARADAPPAEAVPAKAPEQKRRGLFRRKNKSEPAPADTGWVEVASADSVPDEPLGTDEQTATGTKAPTGPRGFGFGGLVSGRFGGGDKATDPADSWADRDTGTPDPRPSADRDAGSPNPRFGGATFDSESSPANPRFGGAFDSESGSPDPRFGGGTSDRKSGSADTRFGGSTSDRETGSADTRTGSGAQLGAAGAGPSADDDGGRRSWADRAHAGADQAPTDGGTPPKDRSGRKSGRADRHLRSVDLGDDQKRTGDGDTGSWDIDDPAPGRSAEDDDTKPDAGSAPSRGLFRRNRNNGGSTETPVEPDGDDAAPEPARGRRGKGGDKPIQEGDEEYVDWVTGLSAPEPPVNERPRDDVPRRSLRSTTRRKDD